VEDLIASLVAEFERGRLTKRQLVQDLAAATALAAGAPAAAAVGSGLKAVAVNHISYRVANYARTRDFYAGLLGMQVSHDTGAQCSLSFGDTVLIPRKPHPGERTPFIDHVAYTIDRWDRGAVEAELKRRGLQPHPDTDLSFHVRDPDGFDLQICANGMKP
jgi:catechol 2,3-dioxygenase-like lactoylglutathione lyase family enzyme